MHLSIRYEAPSTVARFLDSDAFVRVIVGPVGSGKSTGCLMEILRRAMEQARGPDGIRRTRFAVVRNTYRELQDTTRNTFEEWVREQLGRWNEQDFTFHMKFKDVESEILFRALDRAEDVKKLLSLDLTGCYFNELREIAKPVFDGMQARVGRYPSKNNGGPTWFGIWGDTNPWHTGHWGYKLFKSRPEGHTLFKQPGGRSDSAENVTNLPEDYYRRLCIGKDSEWVKVYVDGDYASSDIGSIYGPWLDGLELRGAISSFKHEVSNVITNWDLGIGDANSIWFWRLRGNLPEYLDHYAASGVGMEHYFGILEAKQKEHGFRYLRHYVPHDARARSLQTGRSIIEQMSERLGEDKVAITPEMYVEDRLQATRWLMEQPIRIHSRCEAERGLEALREYRFKWDANNLCFSKQPLHNWASNMADSFGYSAMVVKYEGLVAAPDPAAPRKPPARPINSFTLDELWETHNPGDTR